MWPDLRAAVALYGRQPEAALVPKIKAEVMLHYGGLDEGVNKGIPAYDEALKNAGVKYQLFIYEGAPRVDRLSTVYQNTAVHSGCYEHLLPTHRR